MALSQDKGAVSCCPEDEKLPLAKTFAYGLQHILTMYGGIIAPPLIIGSAAGLSAPQIGMLVTAALFVSGLATLLQTLGIPGFGSRLPLVQGVSFAGVATMVTIVTGDGGLPAVFGAVIAASLVGLLIAPFFSQIIRFFPPVVTGTVVTVIGLSLMPVAVRWAMGGNARAADWGSTGNIGLAAFTLVVILLLNKVGSLALKRLSVLLAMVIGCVAAVLVGKVSFAAVGNGPWLAFPEPFAYGWPTFELSAIISMLLIVLVLLTETTAGLMAVGEIVGSPVNARRIANGLRADMLSSALSPVFNSFPQSSFAQNIGLVAITGVKSRFVVSAGGAILVLLGVLPVLGRLVACIPLPVLGGAGVVLFGSVAASGIRTLAKVDYKDNMNLVVVATAIAFGMIPIVMPSFYDQFPGWVRTLLHSGISASCLVALLLNLLFNPIDVTQDNTAGEEVS
ncbi:Putative purine permease ygfU [Serratia quinivorans]|jgi:xanthine permease|uniref:nucleobase:cation symporter-2 family protein n=1 Tax=Serratia quinivorans TaxID=137545 RepID=UPI00217A14F7|nr:nucleobase:cation symporter-2 family protein [Serratia quinivorans]CAI0823633.1 Putative purine permease ygfU [Serratia quinivorans]CAI1063524.1 Putative purine permease ygfU [Serratia quinivorans]CAI1702077.1 Putative purine permease ygfU [Serratia quinivorans]CAI1768812.1 Putative purine permease ygfU [Serratia quinivorans]CAI1852905.1 Putative purine permease ygfU [Serratia quinivorans]